jgi:hypothetical protein
MSEKKKSSLQKVGAVLKNEKGSFIVLGNNRANKPEYNYDVEVRVTNGLGEVVAYQKNGIVNVFDPRKRPSITDEQRDRLPESLLFELFVPTASKE